jgi:hypothetical protein
VTSGFDVVGVVVVGGTTTGVGSCVGLVKEVKYPRESLVDGDACRMDSMKSYYQRIWFQARCHLYRRLPKFDNHVDGVSGLSETR